MSTVALAAAVSAASWAVPTLTAGTAVTPSKAGIWSRVRISDHLRPPECQAITGTTLIVGSGMFSGGNDTDLMLGSPGVDDIRGNNARDCIVAGGGADSVSGGPGDDILLGGPGDDVINGGPGADICYGNEGLDVFVSCETEIQ